jgi:hypothetical protein
VAGAGVARDQVTRPDLHGVAVGEVLDSGSVDDDAPLLEIFAGGLIAMDVHADRR